MVQASTLPHQRKISDEGMLDRHALQLLGRTLISSGNGLKLHCVAIRYDK